MRAIQKEQGSQLKKKVEKLNEEADMKSQNARSHLATIQNGNILYAEDRKRDASDMLDRAKKAEREQLAQNNDLQLMTARASSFTQMKKDLFKTELDNQVEM